MPNLLTILIEKLEEAEKAASLKNASFGFPNDRIEIKEVHFGDDDKGRVGDILHPDTYIKNITRLHHRTWILMPIREVIELLVLHRDLIDNIEILNQRLAKSDVPELLDKITTLMKATLR